MGFKADLKTAFTANFDGATQLRIVNAFCDQFDYQGVNANAAKADFAADKIIQIVKDVVRSSERRAAHRAVPDPVAIVTN